MTDVPSIAVPASRRLSESVSDGLPQPEQELTPQSSVIANPPETAIFEETGTGGEGIALPGDADEGLTLEDAPILLAQVPVDETGELLETFHLEPCQTEDTPSILLVEDELPWHESPLKAQ